MLRPYSSDSPVSTDENPSTAASGVLEFGLLAVVLFALWYIAQGLAVQPLGRLDRYALDSAEALSNLPKADLAAKAQWLALHAGDVLLALGSAGWVLLHLVRLIHRNRGVTLVSAWGYPGFVFFTGLGLLWLLDYAARARHAVRWLGVEHFDALVWAYAILVVTALMAPWVFAWLARALAWCDRSRASVAGAPGWLWPGLVWRGLVPWALAALWVGAVALALGKGAPAKSSELIRLPVYLLFGWMLYRWAGTGRHSGRAALGVAVVALLAGLALVKTHDFGPVLVFSWVAAVASAALLAVWMRSMGLPKIINSVFAGFVAITLIAGEHYLISEKSPELPVYIQQRIEAIATPWQGPLEYLSELRWFTRHAPAMGHGLGQTPWCGTLSALGAALNPPAPCKGVPKETHSDYVISALTSVFGFANAWAITVALAAWLWWLARPSAPSTTHRVRSADLARATGLCFACVTLMQLLVTSLGGVGLIPLTGIVFPFVGFGGANLVVSAVGIGVLLHKSR